MILTKRQIIDIEIKKKFKGKAPNLLIKTLMSQPDNEFIPAINKDLNWTLEPIAKNRYIVTAGQYTDWIKLKRLENINI